MPQEFDLNNFDCDLVLFSRSNYGLANCTSSINVYNFTWSFRSSNFPFNYDLRQHLHLVVKNQNNKKSLIDN